jgi:hypothetical protein
LNAFTTCASFTPPRLHASPYTNKLYKEHADMLSRSGMVLQIPVEPEFPIFSGFSFSAKPAPATPITTWFKSARSARSAASVTGAHVKLLTQNIWV